MWDLFRVLVILTGLFSAGTLLALYARLGKIVLPRLWMSLLVVSNVLICTVSAWGSFARLGQPGHPRLAIFGVGTLMEFVALVGLYHWYGTPRGHIHMERMKGRYPGGGSC